MGKSDKKMKELFSKLTSRKFILSALAMITGIAIAFKYSSNAKIQIAGYVGAAICAVAYSLIEGKNDKEKIIATAMTESTLAIQSIESIKQKETHNEEK